MVVEESLKICNYSEISKPTFKSDVDCAKINLKEKTRNIVSMQERIFVRKVIKKQKKQNKEMKY